ncbi:ABC transporter substrate-binding protein [Dictyobacter kobayashii]|uniref:Cytochrome c n=1 Tax=Dictyobacter kobayashii TaxID=2014872 RepID=A0A402ABC6_9CHLR|nr:ABC transporter substrate-binding protein [Dictyobacter kobayashii]GCE16315.1 cytochrome c [Dictyobacter kobayashii]
MRKSVLILALFILLGSMLLSGCTTNFSPRSKTIGLSVQAIDNPFFVAIQHGAETAAAQIGAKVDLQDAHHDVGVQSDQMDNFIQKRVVLILLNAVDSAGIAPAVKRATAAGIPVVAVDVGAQGGVAATVTSDNVAAGKSACQYMADKLKNRGQIAIVDGPPVTAVQDRVKGCNEVLSKTPGIKVVATQVGTGDRDIGLDLGSNILTANPKLDAIFAINDPTALGVELAAKQAKRSDFFIVSVDGSPDAIASLKTRGIFTATSAQAPDRIAQQAVQLGIQVLNHQKLQKNDFKIPVNLVTQSNVNSYNGWHV